MTKILFSIVPVLLALLPSTAQDRPLRISLDDLRSHVQGIAWDAQKKQMFFSVTTGFVVTDSCGTVKGSVEGLHGHLGSLVFDSASRKAYASMECKDDVIGASISRQLGVEGYTRSTFYIAEIDVDAVTAENTPAALAIKYHEVKPAAEDYAAEVTVGGKKLKHRYGCSGIEGMTIGPGFGHKAGENEKRYIYVAYGIYSDTTSTNNDYQVLLQYSLENPDRLLARYFIKTGNTNFGIQNLAYDPYTDKLFMIVYKGKKSSYPNYDIFSVDMSTEPYKVHPEGIPYKKGRVKIVSPDGNGWYFRWGKQGLCSLGEGYWYITEDSVHKDAGGRNLNDCTVRLYRWNDTGGTPFSRVEHSSDIPFSCAHRGGHIDGLVPENSAAAVAMAARYGYRTIECDVHYTKDSVLVCMHDGTINRVMRTAEGYEELPVPVKYRDVNYDELRSRYVLASSDSSLRTPIASFEEILAACREYGITAMLHTDEPEAYRRACEVLGPEGFIAFDINYEALKRAREYSQECLILWDPDRTPAEEVIPKLRALGGPAGISSMKRDLLTEEYVGKVRAAGFHVQASIFSMPHDIEAVENGCDIILSDFSLFPPENSCVRILPRHRESIKRHLAPEETISFTWDPVKYGSIELRLDFTGTVEIQVNDDIRYTLTGRDRYLIDGWRFYEKNPSFTITAKEESFINLVQACLFEY